MNGYDLLITIIKDTGSGITVILLGLFALIAVLAGISAAKRARTEEEYRAERLRNHDIDLVKSQLARLVDETKENQKQIAERASRRPRRNAVIEAEIAK
jgi:Na+-transporting methylmalonyl-CoA/oxaloacetate decarboxylase gamma subunit